MPHAADAASVKLYRCVGFSEVDGLMGLMRTRSDSFTETVRARKLEAPLRISRFSPDDCIRKTAGRREG